MGPLPRSAGEESSKPQPTEKLCSAKGVDFPSWTQNCGISVSIAGFGFCFDVTILFSCPDFEF